jgi:hypothetical protein
VMITSSISFAIVLTLNRVLAITAAQIRGFIEPPGKI